MRGPVKSCLRSLSRSSPVADFCFLFLRHIIKCVIAVQPSNIIKCTRCAEGHGGKNKLMLIVPACRTDFFKACNSIVSRQIDGMDAHQIRTKSTDGANLQWCRGDGVVRSCNRALKCMVLGFEGGFIWCTHRPNKTQHRNRVDLEITQSLNQTFGRSINFHHALHKSSWVQSNDEGNHQGHSAYLACRAICMSLNSSKFSEIHVHKESCSSLPY